MSETVPNQRLNVDEIDLTAIFAIFWRHWKLIFFGTLGVTLLAVALSFFIPKTYRSEGFYQLGNPTEKNIGISVPLFKKSAPQFSNPDRFYQYASMNKSCSKNDLAKIKKDFQTMAAINKWILPVYAIAKGDLASAKDESNSVLGLSLSYEADSPQKAYNCVSFFGQYVRDCLLYVSLYEYIKDDYSKVISELSKNENNIIIAQFNVLQNTKKMLDIKAILTKYPASAMIENRQLVSVQEGGSRFLAPVTQLVGIESALADQRRTLAELEREKEKLLIQREYFSKCNDALNKLGRRGEMIFTQIKAIKCEVFKKKDFAIGTVKEVFNNLNIDLQTFDLAFFTNCRFISGPTLPERHIAPRKSIIVITTCFLSFFFFIVLTLVLHWWQSNKKRIKAFRQE
ncbi:MAG: Wzz/FepE/Etk N-terminal domain-containing protein [Candidatus Aminicenantes bacterium]|nr:Wzz/FepE/Etk N-terminal domain-containing protein [Candidatus Aminicenantes bacterium]